ncbi:MAG: filamentous hemagglutinin N-terminal domain-containing protein [Leptolyngbya sp. SIO4C5]|nr:filamentous hemagglutinin N-terminal domain-containing protein [Leptolyngbya sp. SIO4C5]
MVGSKVRSQIWTLCCAGVAGVVSSLMLAVEVLAQSSPVADTTLGTESSVVSPINGTTVDVINGGAIRDQYLLHSFTEFDVGEGRGVYFFSPTPAIETILSRVTGNNRSEILGTLGTFGNSAPNFWLINPNGILFGPNASLDLGGSFVATTANAVSADSSFIFAATDPPADIRILNIDTSVFFLNALSDAQIINQSQAAVLEGRSISLVGQNINFEGGFLNAPNGNIFLNSTDTITLRGGAEVSGGNIFAATDRLSVQDGSQIFTQFTDVERLGGSLQIQISQGGGQLIFTPDSQLQQLPSISGGNLSIVARESINVSDTSPDETTPSQLH